MLMYTKTYLKMSDPKFDEIYKRIGSTYPNCCVLYIQEIQNDEILQRFHAKKLEMMNTNPNVKQVQLFHGTDDSSIVPICTEGFKREYNKCSAYGKGTYFAQNASYSFNYMKTRKPVSKKENDRAQITYMFLADVLLGTYGGINFDYNGSDGIFVVSKDDMCYMRYLVAFHKNAE